MSNGIPPTQNGNTDVNATVGIAVSNSDWTYYEGQFLTEMMFTNSLFVGMDQCIHPHF